MFKYSVVVALCFLATVNSYPGKDNFTVLDFIDF